MQRVFERFDQIFGVSSEPTRVRVIERALFVFIVLMTAFAPHSIAATQTAWIISMLLRLTLFFVRPRAPWRLRGLDLALIGFFVWSAISSSVSYAPDISVDKLRGVSLLLVFFLIIRSLKTVRSAKFLGVLLLGSALVAVVWTPLERIIGRGVQIYDFKGSCFDQIGLEDGDVILRIDGRKVNSPDEIVAELARRSDEKQFKALISRGDSFTLVDVPRERIVTGSTAAESLGIGRWQRSRNWRAAGFYGHYTTFAEMLQLIGALAVGLFVASARRWNDRKSRRMTFLAGIAAASIAAVLVLTVTRASQLAFLVSSGVIVLVGGSRKLIIGMLLAAIPIAAISLFALRDMRRVSFLDSTDNSTTWRQTVYREGLELWTKSPRNFVFGVGMDSIKRYAREWRLFDDGRLPPGHFHSTPLQLVVERGLPALILWLLIVGIYARMLHTGIRRQLTTEASDHAITETGLLLGALGGAVGFMTSGLVHNNLGDGEVALIFYLIMGLSVVMLRETASGGAFDTVTGDFQIQTASRQTEFTRDA